MPSLTSLPTEILTRIISCCPAKQDVASLRLTDRALKDIATEQLFCDVTLPVSWERYSDSEGSDSESMYETDAQRFKNILDHEYLSGFIKKVDIFTCDEHCDHHPRFAGLIEDSGVVFDATYHETWWDCVERLKSLPSLNAVNIHFDRHQGYNENNDILHEPDDRLDISHRIISFLQVPGSRKITHLGIRHYQDDGKADVEHIERNELLRNLLSLRISVSNGEFQDSGGKLLREGEPHTFWKAFPKTFLSSTMINLQRLVLYSDLKFGFFPTLNLTNVHFSNLRSLCLGNYVFAQDSQFDWIISHSDTLREFYLDDCSIVYQVGHTVPGWLGEDGFPVEHPSDADELYGNSYPPWEFDADPTFRDYHTRWYDVFSRFENELPKLCRFVFGISDGWDHDTESRYGYCGGPPIMPWEAEDNIENQLWENRYVIYNDWNCDYETTWGKEDDDNEWWENCPPGWEDRFADYPQCDEEDQIALDRLCERVAKRDT